MTCKSNVKELKHNILEIKILKKTKVNGTQKQSANVSTTWKKQRIINKSVMTEKETLLLTKESKLEKKASLKLQGY